MALWHATLVKPQAPCLLMRPQEPERSGHTLSPRGRGDSQSPRPAGLEEHGWAPALEPCPCSNDANDAIHRLMSQRTQVALTF